MRSICSLKRPENFAWSRSLSNARIAARGVFRLCARLSSVWRYRFERARSLSISRFILRATPASSVGYSSDSDARWPSSMAPISVSICRNGRSNRRMTTEIKNSMINATAANQPNNWRRNFASCKLNESRLSATLKTNGLSSPLGNSHCTARLRVSSGVPSVNASSPNR